MGSQITQLIKRSGNAWSKYGLLSIGTILAQSSIASFIAYMIRQPNARILYFRSLFLNNYSGDNKEAIAFIELSNSMQWDVSGKISFLMAVGAIAALLSWKRHGINFKLRTNDPRYLRPLFIMPAIFLLALAARINAQSAICLSLKHNLELLNYISQSTSLNCQPGLQAAYFLFILLFTIFFLGLKRITGRWLNKVGLF